ncbi:uncharacterized protein TrAFT101_002878 [Trichoderma asperellum]|uniref:uncharacterized protein n=1 Tax=Trichoderma asperellum TaxID=101201 RepID=UPI0033176AD5|nr:hypothetical protein TrAFT101_002878 [Trichoderma asperellum]
MVTTVRMEGGREITDKKAGRRMCNGRESPTSRVARAVVDEVRRPLSKDVAVLNCLKRKFSVDLTTKISPFGESRLSDSGISKSFPRRQGLAKGVCTWLLIYDNS